jgi:hypothetical protein
MNGLWWQIPAAVAVTVLPVVLVKLEKKYKHQIESAVGLVVPTVILTYATVKLFQVYGWMTPVWIMVFVAGVVAVYLFAAMLYGVYRATRVGRRQGSPWWVWLTLPFWLLRELSLGLGVVIWRAGRRAVHR